MVVNVFINDEFGEVDDWFELYNDSEEFIEIGGFYFIDKFD